MHKSIHFIKAITLFYCTINKSHLKYGGFLYKNNIATYFYVANATMINQFKFENRMYNCSKKRNQKNFLICKTIYKYRVSQNGLTHLEVKKKLNNRERERSVYLHQTFSINYRLKHKKKQ